MIFTVFTVLQKTFVKYSKTVENEKNLSLSFLRQKYFVKFVGSTRIHIQVNISAQKF